MKAKSSKGIILLALGIVGWLPAYTEGIVDIPGGHDIPLASAKTGLIDVPMASTRVDEKRRTKARCRECGSIMEVRKIESSDGDLNRTIVMIKQVGRATDAQAMAAPRYEIIIRLNDGSVQAIPTDNPANWRVGERMILIAGANPARERKVQNWTK